MIVQSNGCQSMGSRVIQDDIIQGVTCITGIIRGLRVFIQLSRARAESAMLAKNFVPKLLALSRRAWWTLQRIAFATLLETGPGAIMGTSRLRHSGGKLL